MFRWGGTHSAPGNFPKNACLVLLRAKAHKTRTTRCRRQSTLMKVSCRGGSSSNSPRSPTGQRRGQPARGCWPCPDWDWPRRDRGRSTAALRPRQSRKAGRGASRFPPALARHALAADREEAAARWGDSELILTWRSWFGRNAVSVSLGWGLGGKELGHGSQCGWIEAYLEEHRRSKVSAPDSGAVLVEESQQTS